MIEHNENKQKKSRQKQSRQINSYAKFSGVAFQMIAIIGLGTYGGVKLDEKYPNKYSIFTIIISLTSVAIAMYYVIKQVSNTTDKKSKK